MTTDRTELDEWFATAIMGWERLSVCMGDVESAWYAGGKPIHAPRDSTHHSNRYTCPNCGPWQPTENIAQAIHVAEKMREDGLIHDWKIGPSKASVDVARKPDEGGILLGWSTIYVPGPPADALCRALREAVG